MSNAHNEYYRTQAAADVQQSVPDLLPWVRAGLGTATVPVHVGSDGGRTILPKERGRDQGDALTNYISSLTYKKVASEVVSAAGLPLEKALQYTYQDMKVACAVGAMRAAQDAFVNGCGGFRANAQQKQAHHRSGC